MRTTIVLRSEPGDRLVTDLDIVVADHCGSGSHGTEDSQLGQPDRNGVNIETPSATAFAKLLAGEAVAGAFALRIEDCIGLLGATEERTHETGECPRMLVERDGAAAVIAAEEEPNSDIVK